MTDMNNPNNPRPDTGVPGLAFIVGGLVVAVIIIGYLFFSGYLGGANNAATSPENNVNVNVTSPAPAPAPEPSAAPDNNAAAPPAGEAPPAAPGQEPTPAPAPGEGSQPPQ